MSIEKTADGVPEDLLDGTDLDEPGSPETPRPRLRQAITSSATRVREVAPRAGGAVKKNPVPAAGILAVIGAAVAALIVRRRKAQVPVQVPARRWVPARFQR